MKNLWRMITGKFIRGEGLTEKIPFRPQKGEEYYTIINEQIILTSWINWTIDYTRFIAGIIFRTAEEAEAYLPTWQKRISKL